MFCNCKTSTNWGTLNFYILVCGAVVITVVAAVDVETAVELATKINIRNSKWKKI
jgi:hypothetical protein